MPSKILRQQAADCSLPRSTWTVNGQNGNLLFTAGHQPSSLYSAIPIRLA
ncbi:hypothetical protein ADIMK_0387 [Marinobacterium lacunae]|uniref:Uncharacterized protein n=1 Tax=Marinobacterium lacunae TaxID=1232683 RepID=A0A081G3S5_9GAMM|nr:hypothetical protein ADIMK_0387 [Marinobacterium lacunae]